MKTTKLLKRFRVSFWSWIGLATLLVFLVFSCFAFRSILQPTEGFTNSTFDVPTVIGQNGDMTMSGSDILDSLVIGVLLPNGWSVTDSIPFTCVAYSGTDSSLIKTESKLVYSDFFSAMYEDSVGSETGNFWWAAASIVDMYMTNLDSIVYTLTIHTDIQTGTFDIQYAVGFPGDPLDILSENYPITISFPTAIHQQLQREIQVFPNPTEEYLNIILGDIKEAEFLLIDNAGRTVMQMKIFSEKETINVSEFQPGVYYAIVRTGGGEYSKKIIIK